MAETTLFIYLAAAYAFTLIPIQGENDSILKRVSVKCKSNESSLVGGQCYRINNEDLLWTEARDNCVKWHGQLATFTSLEHVKEVLTTLAHYNVSLNEDKGRHWNNVQFWVGSQNDAEELGLHQSVLKTIHTDAFGFYVGSCNKLLYPSICTENNDQPDNHLTSNARTNATTPIDLKTKERSALSTKLKNDTCLHNDSEPVDGLCFRLSAESFEWSNASSYCKSWNGTLATITSVEQEIKVLTALNIFKKAMWTADSLNSDKGKFIGLSTTDGCKGYSYGQISLRSTPLQVLCIEKPITNAESKHIPLSTTTQQLIYKPESTTKPVTTRRPELITANQSIQATPRQNKVVNQNRLLRLNLLLQVIRF